MKKYSLKIRSDFSELDKVEDFLWNIHAENNFSADLFDNIILSLLEIVSNAITHGNKGNTEKEVTIHAFSAPDKIIFEVRDEGTGFDASHIPDPTLPENLFNPRGRGLFIAKKLSDALEINGKDRSVLLSFFVKKNNATAC